jgi:predicted nucleotidyltransferase
MTTTVRKPTSPSDPTALLFGEDVRRLLGLLLMRPDQDFYVREISRVTGVDVGNTHRTLKRLEQAGLVAGARSGNQVRYKANRASPIFPELQGIVRKTVGLADILREALQPLASRIEFAFVFGSVARGEEGPGSDIDLMVVGDASFDEVVGTLFPLHERLGREVNAVVMKRAEFRRRTKESSFVARVIKGQKLMLLGSLDES